MSGKSKGVQKATEPTRRLPPSMSQSKPISQQQLVPYPGAAPINVLPTPSTLGTTSQGIRPNYSSALIADYDPFQVSQASPAQRQSLPKSSPYQHKTTRNLFTIEFETRDLSNPATIARFYFPGNSHFIPPSPHKVLSFYKDILIETQSVEIKPIRDRENPNKILYHSLYIKLFISQKDWGPHPSSSKVLKSGLDFTYYDYIESWSRVLLHQNPEFTHSWFLNFDSKFKSPIPCWFCPWWDTFGPTKSVFPDELIHILSHFSSRYKCTEKEAFYPTLLIFAVRYKIPWILKWSYDIEPNMRILTRKIFIKWWDKFVISKIYDQVFKDFPLSQNPQKPVSPVPSCSSLQLEGRSKTELKALAREILAHANAIDDDDVTPASSCSSQGSSTSKDKKKKPICWADYQDSQDPFDAYDLNEV